MEVAPNRRLVIASFLAVYLIWGSTYLGIRFAIETIPPFTLAAARFGLAGLIMLIAAIVTGAPKPTRPQIRTAAIVGCLLMLANSLVGVAEKRIPSGVAALIVGLTPVFMVLLEWSRPGGRRPTLIVAAGLTIGLIGIVTLVGPGSFGDGQHVDLIGAAIVAVGSLCWSSGAIYSRHAPKPTSGVMNSAVQMLVGGVFVGVLAVWRGELTNFSIAQVSARSAYAWAYLLIFGSFIGFSAFVYLLRVSTPARVATYAYVNPVVAVILGWLIGHETISVRMIIAAAIIVGGVAIITAGEGRGPGVTKAYPVPKPREGDAPVLGSRVSDRA